MEERHLTLLLMAKLLTNRMEYDELVDHVAPHLLRRCPECWAVYKELQRLKREVGHWDELVVVSESAQVPDLAAELDPLPHPERVRAVEEEERFQTWGFCRWLLERSRKEAFADGQRSVDWAALALRIATHLGEEYGESAVAAIRAEALATLGNAQRMIGEFRTAEESFLAAEELLDRSGDGDPLLMAEVQSLKASLRLDQRRFAESRDLVRCALAVFRDQGERRKVSKLLLLEAKVDWESGHPAEAAEILRRASGEIDPQTQPDLHRMARFNLLSILVRENPSEEAAALLAEVAPLFADEPSESTHRLRLRWAEGLIARGLGDLDTARSALSEVQQEFVSRQMGYDAALVAIDLGLLYLEIGEVDALRRLASELMPIFAAKDLSKEAFASLLLYQDACQTLTLTRQLGLELLRFLAQDRHCPPPQRIEFEQDWHKEDL